MRVTVLGSGTAIPNGDRFPAGYLVEHGATRAMVDCGPGTLRRLAQAGCDLAALDAVLLTHYHTDHCADLAALLFALRSPRYAGRAPLQLYGAPGLERLLQRLLEAWPWLDRALAAAGRHELTPGEFAVGDLAVAAIPIRHTAQSLGFRIAAAGRTVAFSGDADECDELVDLARNADLFVCDAATPDGQKLDGHLTPGLAGAYAARAGAHHLALTHFYPECEGHDLHAMAATRFCGRITVAEDLAMLTPEPGSAAGTQVGARPGR
ncbi:MAG: ribonuclease Z [Planctomycetota bacterium]